MVRNYSTLLAVVNHFVEKSKMKRDDEIFILYNFKDLICIGTVSETGKTEE